MVNYRYLNFKGCNGYCSIIIISQNEDFIEEVCNLIIKYMFTRATSIIQNEIYTSPSSMKLGTRSILKSYPATIKMFQMVKCMHIYFGLLKKDR